MLVCGERRGAFFRRLCMSKVLIFWENSKCFKEKLNQREGIFIVASLELHESCLKQIENYGEYNFQNISVLEKVTVLENNILYRWWSWLGEHIVDFVTKLYKGNDECMCVYLCVCVVCVFRSGMTFWWLILGWEHTVENFFWKIFKYFTILGREGEGIEIATMLERLEFSKS